MTQLILLITLVISLLISPYLQAKNVILFLGDGMGVSTITAARIFAGQQKGQTGEEYELSFDKFRNVALIKTYNTDAQVADSAGTISAIVTGTKTRMGVLSVAPQVARGDCAAALDHELPTLLEMAEQAGMASGLVSTARITHATPAGTYAHAPDRDWEDSSNLSGAVKALGCRDIATQLVEFPFGDGVDVILGGGRAQFLPATAIDPEYPDKTGRRDDNKNLIQQWLAGQSTRRYAWNSAGFNTFEVAKGAQFMALFEPSHLQFEADRAKDAGGEPSLAQMTAFAIKQLQTNDKGYFLLVEAGRIDHAHHFSNAYRALTDTVALDEAVDVALDLIDLDDTLVMVTADHSHTLTISGYPPRGNPILGKVPEALLAFANPQRVQYTTLSYANGPGYKDEYPDLSDVDTTDPGYQQLGTVPLPIETHAGEDVAAFATGKNADAVFGVMEQNKLFNVLRAALFD